ncbi:PIG-L family deacetylase [Rothia sp. P6271]|uniref:PIG-L family deacetylase n=1 Tax=Rothia sp. P6271 TaxID=3402659 RepID=UPI003AC6902B
MLSQEKEPTPYYPEQGHNICEDAVYSLLPEGLEPCDARVLFVHAHPDDESTSTGATMGLLADSGAQVDLVTMTRGELGEVIPRELKHLEVGQPQCTDGGQVLGEYRSGELREAIQSLGVHEHLFLGEGVSAGKETPAIFYDSGMVWGADGRPEANPQASQECLTRTSLDIQVQALMRVIKHYRPHVVVTYDAGGGYGHPDHVRTHEVSLEAVKNLGGTADAPCLLWGLEGDYSSEDNRVQAVIDGSVARKREAMAAHRTQVIIASEDSYQFSNLVVQKISARETYRLIWSAPTATVVSASQEKKR